MSTKINRRQFLAAAGISAVGGLLAACAPTTVVVKETQLVQQEVTKVVEQTSVVKETSVVQQEVTKVVEVTAAPLTGPMGTRGYNLPADALPLEQQVIKSTFGNVGGGYGHLMESIYNRAFGYNAGYEQLVTMDQNLDNIGVGALSWTVSDDGLNWDFKLNDKLVWSDGKPVVASDWVFTLQRSLANSYDFAWFYFDIKNAAKVAAKELDPKELGISAVDDYTLRITTEAPTPYLPGLGTWFCVGSPAAYENSLGETNNAYLDPAKYVSCGPFTLTKFERGVLTEWLPNTKYTGNRINYIEKITETPLPTGIAAYMSGDLQGYNMGGDSAPAELMLVQANPLLRAESHPQPPSSTDYLGFNALQPKLMTSDGKEVDNPFLNIDVRMAFCKAIDKDALVGQIYKGFAYPSYGVLPYGFPNYNTALKDLDVNKFDVAAAQALMTKAGFEGGKGFPKFEFWLRQFAAGGAGLAMAQAIQARWKENLGVDVDVKNADFQGFTQAAFTDKTAAIYYVNYGQDYYDPATFLNVFKASSLGGRHPYDNAEWTAAYNAANSVMDPPKRFEMLKKSEQELSESAAWFFMSGAFGIALWPCNLAGPSTTPNKYGYQFNGGGGPGCTHSWEGQYWSNSTCRENLGK